MRAGSRWFSRRALLLHLALLIWFPGCLVAMWWQFTVALAGNPLGWLYAIEWPVFALIGVAAWWQLIHDDPETVRARRTRRSKAPLLEPEEQPEPAFDTAAMRAIHNAEQTDEELAAYNAYLARLSSSGGRKTWRNPTGADS